MTDSFAIVFTANAAIRFLLEMGSCALLVVIGFKGYRPPLNLLIGIALPLVVMGVWAYFVAPMSAHRLPAMARIVVELVLFGTVAVLAGRQWSAKWGVGLRHPGCSQLRRRSDRGNRRVSLIPLPRRRAVSP